MCQQRKMAWLCAPKRRTERIRGRACPYAISLASRLLSASAAIVDGLPLVRIGTFTDAANTSVVMAVMVLHVGPCDSGRRGIVSDRCGTRTRMRLRCLVR